MYIQCPNPPHKAPHGEQSPHPGQAPSRATPTCELFQPCMGILYGVNEHKFKVFLYTSWLAWLGHLVWVQAMTMPPCMGSCPDWSELHSGSLRWHQFHWVISKIKIKLRLVNHFLQWRRGSEDGLATFWIPSLISEWWRPRWDRYSMSRLPGTSCKGAGTMACKY